MSAFLSIVTPKLKVAPTLETEEPHCKTSLWYFDLLAILSNFLIDLGTILKGWMCSTGRVAAWVACPTIYLFRFLTPNNRQDNSPSSSLASKITTREKRQQKLLFFPLLLHIMLCIDATSQQDHIFFHAPTGKPWPREKAPDLLRSGLRRPLLRQNPRPSHLLPGLKPARFRLLSSSLR